MKEGHDPSDLYFKKISAMWGKSRGNKGEAGRLDRKLVTAQAEDDHRGAERGRAMLGSRAHE